MKNDILIIASAEGFMTKGVEAKLRGIDLPARFSTPQMKELSTKCDGVSLMIVFTDDRIVKMTDTLNFLKDYCKEHDKRIVVIGKREEYEELTTVFPKGDVEQFYERPLDMDKLLTLAEKYMQSEADIARRKSILIVDDDVSYMEIIMDWLKSDYRVSLANSGMEAITWLATNRPDLILLDYEMPITSGPQVLEMIRSKAATASIPVMFLTGKGDKESVMKVLALKPVGYLLKTVGKGELKETIAKYFESVKS